MTEFRGHCIFRVICILNVTARQLSGPLRKMIETTTTTTTTTTRRTTTTTEINHVDFEMIKLYM